MFHDVLFYSNLLLEDSEELGQRMGPVLVQDSTEMKLSELAYYFIDYTTKSPILVTATTTNSDTIIGVSDNKSNNEGDMELLLCQKLDDQEPPLTNYVDAPLSGDDDDDEDPILPPTLFPPSLPQAAEFQSRYQYSPAAPHHVFSSGVFIQSP
uniref:Uncharacterized protein n=1 Tax=Amphimedon queenslandica TaxID=400682 RepID=A0A1X7VR97_AMPQE